MPQILCKNCNQRVTFDNDCSDIIHECNSKNEVLDQEDIVRISTTAEEFGTTVNTGELQGGMLLQGVVNRFQGTLAGIEGEDFNGITRRGADASTHRQRQHYEYVDLKNRRK